MLPLASPNGAVAQLAERHDGIVKVGSAKLPSSTNFRGRGRKVMHLPCKQA
jgi:hypothetical protein